MRIEKDSAVSPVVGVMLMLVVTIIIAAVVSGFAGGLAGDQNKLPQASIAAKYSQTQGLRIDHMGGDPLAMAGISILARQSAMMSAYPNEQNSVELHKNNMSLDGRSYGVSAFRPGDSLFMTVTNVTISGLGHTQPGGFGDPSLTNFTKSGDIGKVFYVEVYDKNGKMITKTDVIISP